MTFFTDVAQATSEPLAASRPTFFLCSTSLLHHSWDTTQTANNVPPGWAPVTKTERHKGKNCVHFLRGRKNQEKKSTSEIGSYVDQVRGST